MPDTIDFTEEAAPQIDFLADEDVAKIGIEEPQRAINQSLRTMQLGALAAPEPPPPTPPLNRVVGKYGLEPSPGSQTLLGPQLTRLAQAIPPGQGPVTRPLSSLGRTALGFGAAALEPQNLLATSFAISPPGALAVGGYFGYQGVKGALDSVRNIVKLMQAPGPVDAAFKQKLSDELVNALSMAVAAGEISAAEARGIRQMVTTPPVQGPLATGAILPPRRGALPMAGPERLGPPVPPARVRTLQEAEANLPGGAPPLVTAAEAGRDESVIEEIRRRNLNTNEKILNAFPELRTRPSPNQQAARLRRAAAERQGPPLPPGAAPQAPRPVGVRTGELQGPDQVVAATRPVVQPMRVENQPVFQGPQIPEVVQAQREREAGMQRELEARRSALQQNIVFWERELEMARNRGDRRAQDNAAKQLLLFRGEYEGIPPVKEIVPKPPIPRAPGSAFRPEVPGTPEQEQESVLAEIRRKNLRTRQQVINNFPGFREGGRSGERAAELLRQAWPQIQGPPLPPEEPPAEPPGAPVPKPPGAPPAAPATEETPQTPPEAPAPAPEPVPAVPPPEAAPSPTPATPTPAPEALVTPEEIAAAPIVPTSPAIIEDTPLAGKTLGEWEAIKDASQLPRGTARAELAKWLAVPNQPSRILQALGNKRRTREIHAPPMEVTPIQPAAATASPVAAAAQKPPEMMTEAEFEAWQDTQMPHEQGFVSASEPGTGGGSLHGLAAAAYRAKQAGKPVSADAQRVLNEAIEGNREHIDSMAEFERERITRERRPQVQLSSADFEKLGKTYFADRPNPRGIFPYEGKNYATMDGVYGTTRDEWRAAELIPADQWKGKTFPTKEALFAAYDRKELERGSDRGLEVTVRGKKYVLGDQIVFWRPKPGAEPPAAAAPETPPAPTSQAPAAPTEPPTTSVEAQPSQTPSPPQNTSIIDHWRAQVEPVLHDFFQAVTAFGVDRLEKNGIKPPGISVSQWLEQVSAQQPTWGKGGRKTGLTGIQMLSQKNLWPTKGPEGEALRTAMLAAIKALKNAPGRRSDWILAQEQSQTQRTGTPTAPPAEPQVEQAAAQPKLSDAELEARSKELSRLQKQADQLEATYQSLVKQRDAEVNPDKKAALSAKVLEALEQKRKIDPVVAKLHGEVFDYRWAQETAKYRGKREPEPSEPQITSKVLKAQKENLLEQVDRALEEAPAGGTNKKILISVPGDGDFTIINNKEALSNFRDIVSRYFPTTVEKSKAKIAGTKVSTTKSGKATAIPAAVEPDAKDLPKIAGSVVSTDSNRRVLQSSYADGTQIISTDGRRLLRIVGPNLPGSQDAPVRFDANGKRDADAEEMRFPNYNQVIPDKPTLAKGGADTWDLWHIANQAAMFNNTFGDKAANAVKLYLNPDRTFGARNEQAGGESFEHNVQSGAIDLGSYHADYLADAFDIARKLGNKTVDLYVDRDTGPIVVVGKNHEMVLMPMRFGEKLGDAIRQDPKRIPKALAGQKAHVRPPIGPPPKEPPFTSEPSKGPGAAAVAEFDEAPPDLEVMGLKTGSPFINEMNRRWRNLFAGFGQLTGRGKTKKDVALSINAMETIPNMVAQQAGNSFRLMLDDVRQQRAVTALMQSLKMSGEGLSQEDAARLGELQFAGDAQGYLRSKQTDMETLAQSQLSKGKRLEAQAAKEWAIALSDARTQFNQLRPVAQEAKRRLDRQLRREAAAGIETNYELWYVPQRYDFDLLPSANRPIVIGGQRGGSPSTSFRKAKYFEDYASAMEAGHIPRTFSIADLIEHRVRQGERLVARKAMFQGLKGMTDDLTGDPIAMNIPKRVIERPDGSVDVQESIPRDYEPVDVIPGVRLAIHKGYARGIRAMTGTSQISESAVVSSLQNLAAVEKHLGLALDTFHLSRTLQTEFALTHRMSLPFTERTRRGAALVEYSTADLDRAVQKGEITQGIADWITKPQSFNVQGRDIQMSPKAVVNLGARNGLGIGRIADVIYKDWIRQTPVFGTINKLVFDKITRSAVAQGFISEFDRVSRQHPEWAGEKVAKTVASDINVLFGNLQKESWIKSPSLNALMQIAFLAPNWVQSLIRREARAVIQVGQAAVGVAKGEGFRIGSAGKAMGEGILMYLVGTQLLNLITRGHLTFQNEEEGHKLDAFIPDPFTPGKGFFISPLSVFGEITHDLIRYAQSKPDLATAITQIGANKFGNVGRAIAVTATGRDPIDNHKLIGTANRAMAAAYQLIPVPITLSGVGKEALGKSFPDLVTRPTTTQVGRQVASSLGFKVEPAPTAQTQISALVDRWKASQEPAVASQVTRRLQEDFGPSNYRELRSALVNEQTDQATRAYRALRQEGKTPEQIRKIIEHPHPFAGSRALEARFVDSLSPQEQKLYGRALDEREEIISRFEQMLDNRPQLTEEERQ